MKRILVACLSSSLLLSGCGTYTGSGAYTGSTLGAILGSAIGGITDGPRGSDIGTIIGMAGGAVVGGAIGNAKDRQRELDMYEYRRDKAERAAARAARRNGQYRDRYDSRDNVYFDQSRLNGEAVPDTVLDSGFDATNSGDDRIYDFTSSDYTGNYTAQEPRTNLPMHSSVGELAEGYSYTPAIEVRNARFVDGNEDGQIERGELSKIIFEVRNVGKEPLYDVQPTVVETTGNRHLFISPNMHVEKIMPGSGIRYTALVKADNRLKPGKAKFCVSVIQGTKSISKVSEFNIPTKK